MDPHGRGPVVIRASSSAAVRQLIAELRQSDPVRREAAIARLRVLGSRAVPALATLLDDDPNPLARQAVLRVLEGLDDARTADAGLRGLQDPDADVRMVAITVLRPWVVDETTTRVMDALTSLVLDAQQVPRVRGAALDALRQLPPDIVGPIVDSAEVDPPASDFDDPAAVQEWLSGHVDAPLSALHDLIARTREQEAMTEDTGRRARWLAARGAVHAALARRESRVALYDLREAFDRATTPLPLDFLSAIGTLGDQTCVEPLARAWTRTPAGDAWWRQRLAATAADLLARHGLTARHAAVKRVRSRFPGFLEAGRGQ